MVDKCRYPQNPNKAAISSGKGKKIVKDCINLSDDNFKDIMEAKDNWNALGDDHLQFEESMQKFDSKKKQEAKLEEVMIHLQGI